MSSDAQRLTLHASRQSVRSGVRRLASSVRHRPFLVVLSSPSGAGKTSICRGVERRDPDVAYSVSATTRPKPCVKPCVAWISSNSPRNWPWR